MFTRTSLATLCALFLALGGAKLAFAQSASAAKGKAAPAKTAPAKPGSKLPTASADQLTAAGVAHLGDYACEFGETVHVKATPQHEGYLDMQHKKAVYTMKPVLSSTGALRLEDVHGRMFFLQIANKSMLMDQKMGQRVVDGCVHDKQRAAAAAPPATSLGLDPAKPAASAPG